MGGDRCIYCYKQGINTARIFIFLEKATMNINICAKCDSGELTEEGVNEL